MSKIRTSDFQTILGGAKLVNVHDVKDADSGFILEFDNDLCLYVGYSGDEGITMVVTKEDDLVESEYRGRPVFSLRKGLG